MNRTGACMMPMFPAGATGYRLKFNKLNSGFMLGIQGFVLVGWGSPAGGSTFNLSKAMPD